MYSRSLKKISKIFLAFIVGVAPIFFISLSAGAATFNPNAIMDDHTFDNSNSMTAAQIDGFLNQYTSSCISQNSGFSSQDVIGYNPSSGFIYSTNNGAPLNVSAGTVIAHAAQAYGINPQVLISMMQEQEGIVTGNGPYGCSSLAISAAEGYGCPDGGTTYNYAGIDLYAINGNEVTSVSGICVKSSLQVGFSQQVIHAAWLLKFGEERSLGNYNWNVQLSTTVDNAGNSWVSNWNNSDDPLSCYGGPMTQGSYYNCPPGSNPSPAPYYDGYSTIDNQSIFMSSGATASFYWYTPHIHGNQGYFDIYAGWFGDPTTPCLATSNISNQPQGQQVLTYNNAPTSTLALIEPNNTGSACTEAHIWSPGFQSWELHQMTAMRATDPTQGTFIMSKSSVDQQEALNYILYSDSNGYLEVHRFSPNFQTFPGYYDVVTNLRGVTPTSGTFVSGDFFGTGYDQLAYIMYDGASGHVEVHVFSPDMKQVVGYHDIVTNLPGISPTSGTFVAGDFLGNGLDQIAYILYDGSTGHVEVHLFSPNMTQAIGYYDVVTNLPAISPTSGTFVAGDFLGNGLDQIAYVLYNGSSGNVEVHVFSPNMTQAIGYHDVITNLSSSDL